MAGATIFAVDNLEHGDVISTGLEFEAEIGMAYLATETYTMEPMGKHHWPHTGFIGMVIDHHISILRTCVIDGKCENQQY